MSERKVLFHFLKDERVLLMGFGFYFMGHHYLTVTFIIKLSTSLLLHLILELENR